MKPSSGIDTDWRLRWIGWRNRLIGSQAFQRWAARFPLTRPVARMRSRRLFDLVAGFAYSQVLHGLVAGGVIERLERGPQRAEALGETAGLGEPGMLRLLRAGETLGLVEETGAGWVLGSEGAALIGAPGVLAMIRHHGLLYADLADPLALLRAGPGARRLPGFWDYEAGEEGTAADYSALMAASQPMVADQLLGAYQLSQHRALLDVGGGEGAFLMRAAEAAPGARLGLFDLPAVMPRAAERLEGAGLRSRVTLHPGSFLSDELPAGYDAVTLNRVLHDHDDAPAMELLRRVRRALGPGGRLLLCEPMAGRREPHGDAYFGLYLWAMGQGRPRRPDEIRAMIAAAGFRKSRLLRTDLPTVARLIVADA